MDPNSLSVMQGAAGAAGGDDTTKYVEEVFSTYVYDGTGSNDMPINNGIDLDGEGGMVWIKNRDIVWDHWVFDTERGENLPIYPNTTAAETAYSANSGLNSFEADGFTLGNASSGTNSANPGYCSWTFRKAPGFFDVVEYDGSSPSAQDIPHNLGCKPGCILIKCTSDASDWHVYHKSISATHGLTLNENYAAGTTSDFNDTEPTSSVFTVYQGNGVNTSGRTYIAYLFADGDEAAAQIFGDDEDESIIKCGSFTTTAGGILTNPVDLGFEPQFVLVKSTTTGSWYTFDTMRGLGAKGNYPVTLTPHNTDAEYPWTGDYFNTTSTGFDVPVFNCFSGNQEHIYVAIRRGLMKTPEDATEVFNTILGATPTTDAQRPEKVDMYWFGKRGGWTYNLQVADRVRGFQSTNTNSDDSYTSPWMYTNDVTAETASGGAIHQRHGVAGGPFVTATSASSNFLSYVFKRASGFFDVVCYDGSNSVTAFNHNLGVKPELVIFKSRSHSQDWIVKFQDKDNYLYMNNNAAYTGGAGYFDAEDTTTTFYANSGNAMSSMTNFTYVAYLFATCPGVSKVGGYTGTGNNLDVDCGFTAGARFVLIKRTDSTGDWYFWDSVRGISSGNEPYLFLDLTTTEQTGEDRIDPLNAGFTATDYGGGDINTSGGEYIYLAIA